MRPGWRGALGVLLLMLPLAPATAQRIVPLIGAGITFSGPDISATDLHAVAGVELRPGSIVGARLDGLTTGVPQGRVRAVSADIVLHASPDPDARVQPYLLGGGTLYFPGGGTQKGVNVGLGTSVAIGPESRSRPGVFLEGRYFRITNYNTQRDDLVLATAGLRLAL